MELEGKTILISGVGPGLGGACAAAALRDGANVIATARNLDRLQGRLRNSIRAVSERSR